MKKMKPHRMNPSFRACWAALAQLAKKHNHGDLLWIVATDQGLMALAMCLEISIATVRSWRSRLQRHHDFWIAEQARKRWWSDNVQRRMRLGFLLDRQGRRQRLQARGINRFDVIAPVQLTADYRAAEVAVARAAVPTRNLAQLQTIMDGYAVEIGRVPSQFEESDYRELQNRLGRWLQRNTRKIGA